MSAHPKKSVPDSHTVATATDSSTNVHQGAVVMKKPSKKSVATSTASSTQVHAEGSVVMKEPSTNAIASTTNAAAAQPPGVVEPIPTALAPTPPSSYVPVAVPRGSRPQRSQINLALKVATEVRASSDYLQQFGNSAPNPVSVADALTLASGWSDSLQNATAWYEYVKQQEYLAWKQALAIVSPLRVPFEFRLVRDASVVEDYPSLNAFFAVARAAARKAVATKKKDKENAAKAASAAPTSTPLAEPTSTPPAAPVSKLLN